MKRVRISRPSPAFVIASLALFISLGGVGYSQLNLPRKSVDSHHLARDLIKGRHLANKAVDSEHLARAAVDSQHLARAAVEKQELAMNAVTRRAVARDAIISRFVNDRSLRRKDFAPGAVPDRAYAASLIPNAGTRTLALGRSSKGFDPPSTTYNGAGNYTLTFDRGSDSIGCAVPHVMPFNTPPGLTLRITRLDCTADQNVIGIATSTGQDAGVLLKITFTS